MTMTPDLLNDFIDGKLAPDEATVIASRIANDPELAAFVQDQRALRAALSSPTAIWLGRIRERVASIGASWIPACAMAAGIGLGVVLAASFGVGTDLRSEEGALIAQGELAHVLSVSLAAEGNHLPAAAPRVAASFWSKNGSFCRSFVTRANVESRLAGIACREHGAWRVAALAAMGPDIPLDSSLSSSFPASVRSVLDNLIVGSPLDSDDERQLRNQGWRPR
jgi:hypothetical protein